jgi:uncharacterized membrane protein
MLPISYSSLIAYTSKTPFTFNHTIVIKLLTSMYLQVLLQLILYFNNILLIISNFMSTRSRPFSCIVLFTLLYIPPENGSYQPKHAAVTYLKYY